MDEGMNTLQEQALRLSRSLEESCNAYLVLLDLERDQRVLLEQGELEKVASHIDLKRNHIEKIQALDLALLDAHTQWQSCKDQAPSQLREHLQTQLDHLQSVMSEILQLQKDNEELMKKHAERIGMMLKEIQKQKTAHQGYQKRVASDAYSRSKFYDKSS